MSAAAQAAAAQTDAAILALLALHGGRVVRDDEGNLRGMTEGEAEFGAALRAEAVRRGLRGRS